MKQSAILVVTSLLSILLLTLHITDDIVRGISKAEPVIHMRGVRYGEIATSSGGFFFVWTLWALGGLGGVTLILSARGLWSLRRAQSR
jgi:hypothetical protein